VPFSFSLSHFFLFHSVFFYLFIYTFILLLNRTKKEIKKVFLKRKRELLLLLFKEKVKKSYSWFLFFLFSLKQKIIKNNLKINFIYYDEKKKKNRNIESKVEGKERRNDNEARVNRGGYAYDKTRSQH
jgi:hypothetical protein